MKANIELIGLLKYEKDGKQGTRISYRFSDKEFFNNGSSGRSKGYSDLSIFVNGHEVYDKIPAEWCGKICILEYDEEPYPNNPFKRRTVFTKINDISLV